ncbi:response regulator [Phenylobacterium sp. LjRoot219]|uniref:response regulator n=1 Tax=Phenylobacterium sp. LjRoot219 TaxID=3342283 RepID=UPI003ECCB331
MFKLITKTPPPVVPQVRRVLIVDPQPVSAQALGAMLALAGRPEIWAAATQAKALAMAAKVNPDVIFCELATDKLDGLAFTRALRRSDLGCRKAPVVLVSAKGDPAAVLSARDAGAHEFLRRPFTHKDLHRRLEAVTLQSRGWVEAVDYVGPDRRRFNSAEFEGPLKRQADLPAPPRAVRVGEALKVVRAALAAIDRDPAQAMRALLAQTAELEAAAAEASDQRLATANSSLHSYLEAVRTGAALNAAEARARAEGLLNYAGREPRAA